jgi:hypothetical protein
MAGKNSPQTTAAAPVPSPSAPKPAESAATGNNSSSSTPPPAPPQEKQAQARKPSQAPPTPENAAPTAARTAAELAEALADLEKDEEEVHEGKAGNGNGKSPQSKGASQGKAKEEKEDKVDDLEDVIEAAAKAAKLKTTEVAGEAEKTAAEKEAEEVEPPEATDKEAYDSWIKSLSKPAAKKIEQQRNTIGTLKATAAERIVLQPTISAPLSHVTTVEQLDREKSYWTKVRDLAKKGEPFTITGGDGKKVELDPENDEHAPVIEQYRQWAEAALEAVPDAKERLNERAKSKPWEAAEKLAPGIFSDKDSFAAKEFVKFLKVNPWTHQSKDYEVQLAHMVRSMQQDEDEKPTADYPKGRFKHVKLPLDKEGNVIVTKKAPAGGEPAGKRAPTNVGSKPVVTSRAGNANVDELYAIAEKTGRPEDLQKALKAEMRG